MVGNIDKKIDKLVQRGKSVDLIKMLDRSGEKNALKIIPLLGQIGDDKAVNSLIGYLEVKNEAVRLAVIKAMGATHDQTAKTHLQHLVKVETDENMLQAIREAIAVIPTKG